MLIIQLEFPDEAKKAVVEAVADSFDKEPGEVTDKQIATWIWLNLSVETFGKGQRGGDRLKELGATCSIVSRRAPLASDENKWPGSSRR